MENNLKTERELLELVGRFYKERNIDLIRPYLHKNISYASVWVKEVLIGTNKFLRYFEPKFQTQAKSNWKLDYEIQKHFFRKCHFLILQQNNISDEDVLVMVSFFHGKIKSISLYPTKEIEYTFYKPPYEWTIKDKKSN